ncbi:ABC transporter substrate-binding protein [Roseovarius sp. 2305UL8-3]|uniref:ABC transporter substrate-binding protein n=1 Tax=Roseovarius conchicola TaxID=3121636 RepID=UPI0035281584
MTLSKTGRLSRRNFLQTAAAGAVVAGMPLRASAAPKRGGHLRIGLGHGQTSDTMNPATYENNMITAVVFATHGRLTEVAQDGTLKPEVAESWEASDDATEWRVKIRSGVTFHNGKTVTAQDVANSINYHRGEDSTSAAKPIVAPIVDLSIEGDVVVFKLSGGNADFPFILSDPHLVICPADGDGIDWQSGIGCGSYKLKSFQPGISAVVERNENHWNPDVGWFDSVEILALIDQNARTTALVSGDVDAVDRIDLKTAALLQRKPDVSIKSVSGTQHFTFAMSANQDPFTDNNVRQALKYGINREELVEKILFGYGSVGNDHPIGSGQRYFNSELEQKTYDPDKSKWYLQQSGLDSVSVSLSASDAAFGGSVDAGVLFQASAKAAGIDLKVVREPKDGYWSDVWMKKPFSAVYWSGRPVEDQMFTTAYSCGAPWNDSFWCNDRFEELLKSARAELDDDKRRQMYWEMQDIVANDGGVIIPMFANYVFATNGSVAHDDMASNWDLDGLRFIERWWKA